MVSLSTLISIWPGTSTVAQWLRIHLQCKSFRRLGFRSLGQEDPLEKGMATYSTVPAWRISWTEEPGRLQFMESQRVGHDYSDLSQESELISWNVFYFPQNSFCFPLHLSLPILFQNTKGFYNISDQWLHHIIHILLVDPPIFLPLSPPFHLFSPFCSLDFLDLLVFHPLHTYSLFSLPRS